jgi:hypothetical protein
MNIVPFNEAKFLAGVVDRSGTISLYKYKIPSGLGQRKKYFGESERN